MNTTFSDANVSPEVGADIANIIGVNALDLQNPDTMQRYNDIVKYLGRFSDAPALLRMVTHGTPTKERLAKVYEYIGLRKKLDVLRDEMRKLPPTDTIKSEDPSVRMRREELQATEHNLITELMRYE